MMLLLSVFSLHYLRLPVVVVAPICVSFFSCFLLEYLLAAESWRCKITSDELSAYSSAVASGASSAAGAAGVEGPSSQTRPTSSSSRFCKQSQRTRLARAADRGRRTGCRSNRRRTHTGSRRNARSASSPGRRCSRRSGIRRTSSAS